MSALMWLGTTLDSEVGAWSGSIGSMECTVVGSLQTDFVAVVTLNGRRWTARGSTPQGALMDATDQAAEWSAGWSSALKALLKRHVELAILRRPAPKKPPYST